MNINSVSNFSNQNIPGIPTQLGWSYEMNGINMQYGHLQVTENRLKMADSEDIAIDFSAMVMYNIKELMFDITR